MEKMMQEEIRQLDKLPKQPIWDTIDVIKYFFFGTGFGIFVGWLLAHC